MSLLGEGVAPATLGQDVVINNLPAMLTSLAPSFSYAAMSPVLATAGCVFTVYTRLLRAPGVVSWGDAYELLDPTGYSMQNGQAAVAQLIQRAFNYMITQNYGEGMFHLTREVFTDPPAVILYPPRAVILTLWISIINC
jgi:hypothetical protein